MEMGMWDMKSGQGRHALFYLNPIRSAVGQLERARHSHYCRLNVATAESCLLFWLGGEVYLVL